MFKEGKAMNCEDRDYIRSNILDFFEKSLGYDLDEMEVQDFIDFFDHLIEPYTEGDW